MYIGNGVVSGGVFAMMNVKAPINLTPLTEIHAR